MKKTKKKKFSDLYAMKVTLTSEDLSKHFGDQVSDEVHSTLVNQGIHPILYAWSIIVDIDEYTLSHEED